MDIKILLISIGVLFSITCIILFVLRWEAEDATTIKIFGVELQTKNASLIVFITGAAIIGLGASMSGANGTADTNLGVNQDKTGKKQEDRSKVTEENNPYATFILIAEQPQVFNDLKIRLTLQLQRYNEQRGAEVMLWRRIIDPINDTAMGTNSGNPEETMTLMRINEITPVVIPDVGQFQFYLRRPVVENDTLPSVDVQMFRI